MLLPESAGDGADDAAGAAEVLGSSSGIGADPTADDALRREYFLVGLAAKVQGRELLKDAWVGLIIKCDRGVLVTASILRQGSVKLKIGLLDNLL